MSIRAGDAVINEAAQWKRGRAALSRGTAPGVPAIRRGAADQTSSS